MHILDLAKTKPHPFPSAARLVNGELSYTANNSLFLARATTKRWKVAGQVSRRHNPRMRNARLLQFLFAIFCANSVLATEKPNIIFILADDLGYGDVGCYGQKLIQTPNIDKLAKEGTRFTQCYAGNTVCAPSRCALMTGYHTGHASVRVNGNNPLTSGNVTVGKILQDAGYVTGLVGKWALGNQGTSGEPMKQGFDYSFGYLDQSHAHDYWTDHLFRNGKRLAKATNLYSHDLFAAESLDFVRREKEKPFFLYAAFTLPHGFIDPPNDEPYGKEDWPSLNKKLAAMITRLDKTVGEMMALLDELKLREKTIVFFTSDNGPDNDVGNELFHSNGPLRGIKRDLYEGGIRVPMIVRWPGKVPAGATSDQIWAFWDFLPTAAEIAGTAPPKCIDGVSVLSALLGKSTIEHSPLYWEFYERGFEQAARFGDWKAVRHAPGKALELYNLKSDLGEKEDVAASNPELVGKMEESLRKARSPYLERPDFEAKATATDSAKAEQNP
jgi:arylsulfatase A